MERERRKTERDRETDRECVCVCVCVCVYVCVCVCVFVKERERVRVYIPGSWYRLPEGAGFEQVGGAVPTWSFLWRRCCSTHTVCRRARGDPCAAVSPVRRAATCSLRRVEGKKKRKSEKSEARKSEKERSERERERERERQREMEQGAQTLGFCVLSLRARR
jgi:hypothetical protein